MLSEKRTGNSFNKSTKSPFQVRTAESIELHGLAWPVGKVCIQKWIFQTNAEVSTKCLRLSTIYAKSLFPRSFCFDCLRPIGHFVPNNTLRNFINLWFEMNFSYRANLLRQSLTPCGEIFWIRPIRQWGHLESIVRKIWAALRHLKTDWKLTWIPKLEFQVSWLLYL